MADIKQTIPEFYKGRSIFITGATGFMGKVLMEKILRSCPDVATIYILVRPKKGHDPQTRVKIITDLPLFDRLKQEQPNAVAKIKPMEGDASKLELGLSNADRQTLEENVSIVFHMAANVRFDDSLWNAVFMNTRSTREVVQLAKNMKQIRILVHVSTAYTHTEEREVYEKIYPPPADWQQIISLAENVDNFSLRILTPKVLNTYPNTYTFTKALAEQVITDHDRELPVVIVRPSVMVATEKEPMPGWLENLNGPVGLMLAVSKGISHVCYLDKSCKVDYLPVDTSCNGFIIAAWYHAHQSSEDKHEVPVYNIATGDIKDFKMSDVITAAFQMARKFPTNNMLYYPCSFTTTNRLLFYLSFLLFHILPAILVDTAMCIVGNKFRLMKIQRRIYITNLALSYFALNEWNFHNDKLIKLEKYLKKEDMEPFSLAIENIDLQRYMYNAIIGSYKYLLKEDLFNSPAAHRHLRRMTFLHYILCTATASLAVYLLHITLTSRVSDTLSGWWPEA